MTTGWRLTVIFVNWLPCCLYYSDFFGLDKDSLCDINTLFESLCGSNHFTFFILCTHDRINENLIHLNNLRLVGFVQLFF